MEENMSKRHKVLFPIIFAVVAVVGLFYVKWDPYYAKAFVAAAKGSIGSSIITGTSAQAQLSAKSFPVIRIRTE